MQILNFQVSVFGDYSSYGPTSKRIMQLMDTLPGFLPGTLQEIKIDPNIGTVVNKPRIQMVNGSIGWRIDVKNDRLDVVYAAIGKDTALTDCIMPSDDGVRYLLQATSALDIKTSNRLAINATYAIPVGKNRPRIPFLPALPACFEASTEFTEWTLSLNAKGNVNIHQNEPTNEILTWNLGTPTQGSYDFAVLITVDINTTQTNILERFKILDMNSFKTYATPKMLEFVISVSENINVRET